MWRDNNNTSVTLPNDMTLGTVDNSDYDVWFQHFGQSLGAGAAFATSAAAAVPEPTAIALVVILLIGLALPSRLFFNRGQ